LFPGYKVTPDGYYFNFKANYEVDPVVSFWKKAFTHPKDRVPFVKWNTRFPLIKKTNPESFVVKNKTVYKNVSPTISGEKGNYTIGVDGNYVGDGSGQYVTEIIPTSELPKFP